MKTLKFCLLLAMGASLLGCSTIHKTSDSHLFAINPVPAFDIGTIDSLDDAKLGINYQINDQKVFKYVQYLKDTLRKKVKQGRVGEEYFSSFQVITASLASAFSASTGVHPDVVTSLAGLSALSPDIADIINADEKARAYAQTLEMIEAADAAYVQARAQVTSQSSVLIPNNVLTPQGAALFVSTVAAVKVMRDALLGTIPKVEDLEKAMGKYAQFALTEALVTIDVPAADLAANETVKPAKKPSHSREVLLYKGEAITKCSSSTPAVVKVTCISATKDRIELQAESVGEAKITIIGSKAETTTIDVVIKEV